jgi:hypothetical protein
MRKLAIVISVFSLSMCGLLVLSSQLLAESVSGEESQESTIMVYYFRTNVRCATCKKLEAYAREVVERDFAQDLKSGRLQWKMVNMQEPENEHFVNDFQLVTKSVVLVEQVNGKQKRWKNLSKIWELVMSQEKYQEYIRSEIEIFLGTT